MLDKILIAIDSSDCSIVAIDYGLFLAHALNAKISLLHVIDTRYLNWVFLSDISGYVGASPQMHVEENLKEIFKKRGQGLLEVASARCKDASIKAETLLLEGDVTDVITHTAHVFDLVIMGESGENKREERKFLGSTAEEVSRSINKPLIITPYLIPKLNKVLLAYDGSNFANDALSMLKSLGTKMPFYLKILSVISVDQAPTLLEEAKKAFEPATTDVEYIVREGDPEVEILDYAAEEGVDLIAMGAYGHGRIIELILGSTTEYVLRNAKVPVLLLR